VIATNGWVRATLSLFFPPGYVTSCVTTSPLRTSNTWKLSSSFALFAATIRLTRLLQKIRKSTPLRS
jgi:hypothetical protein